MGRLALTNYLMQSILMLGILSGAGFSLADQGQFLIALIAVGMWGLQLGLSHLYLRQFQQGPAEYCWRLYTYRTPSAD
jgi:uncharacterized protein